MMVYCAQCGTENTGKFCVGCGVEQHTATAGPDVVANMKPEKQYNDVGFLHKSGWFIWLGPLGMMLRTAYGKLSISSRQVRFSAQGLNFENPEFAIETNDIVSIDSFNFSLFMPTGVAIKMRNEKVYKLITAGRSIGKRKEIINSIRQALR